MIEISYEIGGKKVSPNNFKDALTSSIIKAMGEKIKKKIKSTRCSEHNGSANIRVVGSSLSSLKMEVSGCCSSYIDKVKKELQ